MKAAIFMLIGASTFAAIIFVTHATDAAGLTFVAGAVFGLGCGAREEKRKIDSLRAELFAKEFESLGYLRAVAALQARLSDATKSEANDA